MEDEINPEKEEKEEFETVKAKKATKIKNTQKQAKTVVFTTKNLFTSLSTETPRKETEDNKEMPPVILKAK